MFDGPEFEFAARAIKKIVVFILIAVAAIVLHLVVNFLERNGSPSAITTFLTFFEYLILIADGLWFLKFLLEEISDILKELFSSRLVGFLFVTIIFIIVIMATARFDIFGNTNFVVTKSLVESRS